MSETNQHKFIIELAGQKLQFATSPETETKLRAAASLVNEQISTASSGANKSLERAAVTAALKLAGEVIELRAKVGDSDEPSISNATLDNLTEKLNAIESQIDEALESLSLPGTPRSIVP